MGIVRRPAARARRPRLTAEENATLQRGLEIVQDREATALKKLDERLHTIVQGAKAPSGGDAPLRAPTFAEEAERMQTTDLLRAFLRAEAHPFRCSHEEKHAIEHELDTRIPRRRA